MKETMKTTFSHKPSNDEIHNSKTSFARILSFKEKREVHQIRTDITHDVQQSGDTYTLVLTYEKV